MSQPAATDTVALREPTRPSTAVWRQMLDFTRGPLDFIAGLRQLGEIVATSRGTSEDWYLFAPRHAKHILVDQLANYSKQTRGFRALRVSAGQGLVTAEGDLWRRQRRIANPAFRRESIAAMGQDMVELTRPMVQRWADTTEPLDVSAELMHLTLQIAARTLCSTDLSSARGEAIAAARTVDTAPITLAAIPAICPIGSIAMAFRLPMVSPA